MMHHLVVKQMDTGSGQICLWMKKEENFYPELMYEVQVKEMEQSLLITSLMNYT